MFNLWLYFIFITVRGICCSSQGEERKENGSRKININQQTHDQPGEWRHEPEQLSASVWPWGGWEGSINDEPDGPGLDLVLQTLQVLDQRGGATPESTILTGGPEAGGSVLDLENQNLEDQYWKWRTSSRTGGPGPETGGSVLELGDQNLENQHTNWVIPPHRKFPSKSVQRSNVKLSLKLKERFSSRSNIRYWGAGTLIRDKK